MITGYSEIRNIILESLQGSAPIFNDVRDGSVFDYMISAISDGIAVCAQEITSELSKLSLSTATGTDLRQLALSEYGIADLGITKASGYVTFKNKSLDKGTTIPKNWVIKSENGVAYETLQEVFVNPNSISSYVPIQCKQAGSVGNTDVNTINVIEGNLNNSNISVLNKTRITGGRNQLDDNEFREYVLGVLSSFKVNSRDAVKQALMTTNLVSDVVIHNVIREVTDNVTKKTLSICKPVCYVGLLDTTKLTQVKSVVDNVTPLGTLIEVIPIKPKPITIRIHIHLLYDGDNYETFNDLRDYTMITKEINNFVNNLPLVSHVNNVYSATFDPKELWAYIVSKFPNDFDTNNSKVEGVSCSITEDTSKFLVGEVIYI